MKLYISPQGNDAFSGTLPVVTADGHNGPLATIGAARDRIRAWRGENNGGNQPVTVQIADGVYELAEPLVFAPEDGGTPACPVRYVAAAGAAPCISGGRRINDWRETTHNGQRCWIADVPETARGEWTFTRLYVNGTARARTRLPKTGFHRFTGLAGYPVTGDDWNRGPNRANFAPGNIQKWHNWQDVEIVAYQLWFDTHHRIKAIDEETGTVHFYAQSLGSLQDERGQFARYVVENVFEALDTPGEWYLDRSAGKLYYLPLAGETLDHSAVVAPCLTELLRLQGDDRGCVAHLHFENLTFAHQHWELPLDCAGYIQAAWGVPGAITLDGAEHCVFYGCTVAHVNSYGIEVLAGGTANTIAACTIHDTGAGGIKVGHEQLGPHSSAVGGGLKDKDVPPIAATVADCTIRDCGHIYPSAIGIWVGNSGWNRIVHNRIFNCTYTGISCGWTWGYAPTRTVANRIEYNHIHHINHLGLLSDNGGIYTLGRQPGSTLRGNVIHDIACYGYGGWGIYPDEGSSGLRIDNNLVFRTKEASFSTHYGQDNLVCNNIFALSREHHLGLGKREAHRTTVLRRNILLPDNGLVCGNWPTPHATVTDNLFWTGDGSELSFDGASLAEQQANGQNRGAVVADPLFADADGGDFSLRADSPAAQIGFKPFDWRLAGPRFHAERPVTFADYAAAFSLPNTDIPVVQTQIDCVADSDASDNGPLQFDVTVANLGRAPAAGALRLQGGPDSCSATPSLDRIAYDLLPGARISRCIGLAVDGNPDLCWLETEPEDDNAVPARALVFAPTASTTALPIEDDITLETAYETLAQAASRGVRMGARNVADFRCGATAAALWLLVNFNDSQLRPNHEHPWQGTGIELLIVPPAGNGTTDKQIQKQQQFFLVPHENAQDCDALVLKADGKRAVPAPAVQVAARPTSSGCAIVAAIPWSELHCDNAPESLELEMIVDIVRADTGTILQLPLFDLPAVGRRRQYGTIELITTRREQ